MFAVIMAGGQGTRLWPLSRQKKPKQLHALMSEKSLIRETYERLILKLAPDKIVISTTPEYKDEIKKQIPEIPEENYVVEPYPMNTAGACGLVTMMLDKREHDSTVIFLPSDHTIKDVAKFIEVLDFAEKMADKYPDYIQTIGINPTKPDTGLGYIQIDTQVDKNEKDLKIFSVKKFIEKPPLEKAKEYISSWQYLWNAGIFVWKSNHFLSLFKEYLPKSYQVLEKIVLALGTPDEHKVMTEEYKNIENTSVDYGILEKNKDILVIPGDFGWSDIGSWEKILEELSGNHGTTLITKGHHIGVHDENCLIMADNKLIATVGLKDIIVVDTPDAILICNSKKSQEVKELLAKLKEEGKYLYL